MSDKKQVKVLVCLSGGVDSSVAAALLVKQGYNVTAMFAVNYDDPKQQESCWRGDYQDALRVAAKLGINLLRWDFQKEYQRDVLKLMYQEYSVGRTPNPDVLCNKFVKFGAWLKKAKQLNFDYIATGHYARVAKHVTYNIKLGKKLNVTRYKLQISRDKNKDQTYFLHQLNQEQLQHIFFPIGDYTKPQVRALAKKFNLPTAEKEESMGICFVGEVPMKKFLQDKIKSKPGKIVDTNGNVLGSHDGLPFYTIGERIGVKYPIYNIKHSTHSKPLYVLMKNFLANTLIVGFENDPELYKKEIAVDDLNWIAGQAPKFPLKCQVRLRHRQEKKAVVVLEKNKKIIIKFNNRERAVTPGQFAVLYKQGACLGGGVII